MEINQSGSLLTAECGSCLLAPTLQSGGVYYLRFEVQKFTYHPENELFFGVTTNTDPAGLWLGTDAGWFLRDSVNRNCKLTNGERICDDVWSGWQQGDQPVFKVDLINYTLHVQCARLSHHRSAAIARRPQGAMFFCVTMHSASDIVVKSLPVLAVHEF